MEGQRPCHWFYMCDATRVATEVQAMGITPADVLYRSDRLRVPVSTLRLATDEELIAEGWQVVRQLQHRM